MPRQSDRSGRLTKPSIRPGLDGRNVTDFEGPIEVLRENGYARRRLHRKRVGQEVPLLLGQPPCRAYRPALGLLPRKTGDLLDRRINNADAPLLEPQHRSQM